MTRAKISDETENAAHPDGTSCEDQTMRGMGVSSLLW
ncbi:hypothetical protein BLEM_2301 [Bifidobacterium lemurum]|uniref:Uncharacterized protein n=1 Tax=Bifidobacterium lemurum TaxID=1603886 RepID=A0A261FJ59_9BIFI|nr:hypothetical protein BLEM_2301 [Bifidobacterium lemurum]